MTIWSSRDQSRREAEEAEDAELSGLVMLYLDLADTGGRYAMQRARLGDQIRAQLDDRGGEAVVCGRTVRQCGGRIVIERGKEGGGR